MKTLALLLSATVVGAPLTLASGGDDGQASRRSRESPHPNEQQARPVSWVPAVRADGERAELEARLHQLEAALAELSAKLAGSAPEDHGAHVFFVRGEDETCTGPDGGEGATCEVHVDRSGRRHGRFFPHEPHGPRPPHAPHERRAHRETNDDGPWAWFAGRARGGERCDGGDLCAPPPAPAPVSELAELTEILKAMRGNLRGLREEMRELRREVQHLRTDDLR